MSVWTQSRLTESYRGIRDEEGHIRDSAEPPAPLLGVNMGSSMPEEGKNSTEQQGAGDGCPTQQTMV